MHINDFDYNLPEELIAQFPADKRDHSRLMVVNRGTGSVEHKHFYNIIEYLKPGDCLVLNNSRVIPARIFGIKASTGAKVEFLLIKRKTGDVWETMVRPGKKIKKGDVILFGIDADRYISECDSKGTKIKSHMMQEIEDAAPLKAKVLDYGDDGTRFVEFSYEGIFLEILEELGKMPLPPYIERESVLEDKERYQTVYSKKNGSVAAPTAGLHFTEELLKKAKEMGVKIAYVTLHVGIGTFRPVKCDNIEDHKMHFEEYSIDEENAQIINSTIKEGGRIICVGTTSTRTIESAAVFDESLGRYIVPAKSDSTGIFIYPGYEFKITGSLITNFHLPKSTLLMLVSAFAGYNRMRKAYAHAIAEKYRFFSYGDAMFLTNSPDATD